MDDEIATKAFSANGACSSKFVTERKSCKIEEEPEADILFLSNSSNSQGKITNFSKMFDDAFSYKKEPSINFDIEYHSHQGGFYDNDIHLDELPQSDIYLEEGSRSQHDIDQNICLDNIAGDTDEDGQPDGFGFSLPSSAALSDHNYNRNANYKYFKNLVHEIEKIINISKTGAVSIQFIEQISKLVIEIKKEFGLDSSLITKNIKEELQLADNETSQKNTTKTFNLKNIKTSQTTDSIDLNDKGIFPEISTTATLDLNQEPGTSNVFGLDNNVESYGGEEIFDLNENSLNKNPVNLNIQNEITNIKKENIIKTEIERDFEGNFARNYNSTPEIIVHNQENDAMEVENEPNEIETNENDGIGELKNTSKNENVAIVKDISELENEINDIHRKNLDSQNQTENQKEQEENLEYNSDEPVNEVEPISGDQNNVEFPENCSEPLEYDAKNYSCNNSECITEQVHVNDDDELISPDIELTKNKDLDNDQEKLNELHTFGMRLVKSCEERKKTKNHKIDDIFLNELILDFQKIVAYRKTFADISVQTHYSGRHLSKEKQRRINEKEKKRLLADSDSCSDEASDLSEVYTSEENLSPIMDGNISDENTRSPPSVEFHDSDSDGLDLRKYISVNYSDTENADNQSKVSIKATETRSAVSLLNVNNGSDIEIRSDTEDYKMDEGLQNEDKQILRIEKNNDVVQDENIINSEDHFENTNISSICIPSDEKLQMDAVVIVEKLTDDDLENYYDELREKEIDRLLNLKSLDKRRFNMVQYTNHDRVVPVPKRSKSAKLLEMLNDTDKALDSDESNTEVNYREYTTETLNDNSIKIEGKIQVQGERRENATGNVVIKRFDDFSAFGTYVSVKIGKLKSIRRRLLAQQRIMNILREMELDEQKENLSALSSCSSTT